ncbi:MAG: RNA polymerase sigma-70 factor (ECF subfamily) [Flavobacteriales bacterium]|jgi:RNA polymerase sigma-70 factor (ECF subfamily)
MTENQLIKSIAELQNGSEAALSDIYDAYSAALFGIILKIVREQDLAEDVLQESFVKIWKKVTTYDSNKSSFFTWMLNICRNSAIDKYRSSKTKWGHANQIDSKHVDNLTGHSTSMKIEHIGVKELMEGLPEEQREIIDYLYFRGYTQQELSDELNIPLGTIKTRSRSAIKVLKELFSVIALWT